MGRVRKRQYAKFQAKQATSPVHADKTALHGTVSKHNSISFSKLPSWDIGRWPAERYFTETAAGVGAPQSPSQQAMLAAAPSQLRSTGVVVSHSCSLAWRWLERAL